MNVFALCNPQFTHGDTFYKKTFDTKLKMKWLFANELTTFKKLSSAKTEGNFVKFFGYMFENRPDFGSIFIKQYNYGTLHDFSRNVILITYNQKFRFNEIKNKIKLKTTESELKCPHRIKDLLEILIQVCKGKMKFLQFSKN